MSKSAFFSIFSLFILFSFAIIAAPPPLPCDNAAQTATVEPCGSKTVPAMATAGEEKKCGEDCPVRGHEVVKESKDITLSGTIACMHCDLHKASSCEKVLVTAGDKIFHFCPDSLGDVKIDKLQGKEVTVTGNIQELKDGDSIIHLLHLDTGQGAKA